MSSYPPFKSPPLTPTFHTTHPTLSLHPLTPPPPGKLDHQACGNALYGMKGTSSEHPEVRRVLNALADRILVDGQVGTPLNIVLQILSHTLLLSNTPAHTPI